MKVVTLPGPVQRNLCYFGDRGAAWAESFERTLADVGRRWQLELSAPYPDLSYAFVAPARRGGEAVVLKLGVPGEELASEVAALEAFRGRGAVRLLEADVDRGALLLERVLPGTKLAALDDDDRAMGIAAELARGLWHPPPRQHPFRDLRRWADALYRTADAGEAGPLSLDLVALARAQFDEWLADARGLVVLHADFHQHNVLEGPGGAWVVIDPKGGVGHPGFELGPLLTNCLDGAQPESRLQRRARRLERELSFDASRILVWTLARQVLSTLWSFEAGDAGLAGALRATSRVARAAGVAAGSL